RDDGEVRCTITKVTSVDHQGRRALGTTYEELCSILKLPGEDIDVSARIASSPDRPAASPRREHAVLLLRITPKTHVDDAIPVAGMRLRAVVIWPGYDDVGKLAHHVVQAVSCD